MKEVQETKAVEIAELNGECAKLAKEHWRLVQIGCTGLPDGFEINYTFDKNYKFLNLRVFCPIGGGVPSIQKEYFCAFAYENEISELFGVRISGMAVDFNGLMYKISEPTPFSEVVEGKAVE